MIKTFSKLGIEGTYLNTVKAIYDNPTANIILNCENLKSSPPKIRNKMRVSTFTTIIQRNSGSLNYSREKKKMESRSEKK